MAVATERGPTASQITVPVAVFGVTLTANVPVSPSFIGLGPTASFVMVAVPLLLPTVTVAGSSLVVSPEVTLV